MGGFGEHMIPRSAYFSLSGADIRALIRGRGEGSEGVNRKKASTAQGSRGKETDTINTLSLSLSRDVTQFLVMIWFYEIIIFIFRSSPCWTKKIKNKIKNHRVETTMNLIIRQMMISFAVKEYKMNVKNDVALYSF
jgi:hypothetical protein